MANEEQFVKKIKAFSILSGQRIDFVMRKISFDALAAVLRRSPVDTGRFRGSWRYSVNSVDTSVEPKPAKGTKGRAKGSSPAGAEIVGALAKQKLVTRKSVIHITNSLPYAVRLEDGYSPQSPNGIVKPAFLRVRLDIIKAVGAARKAIPDA